MRRLLSLICIVLLLFVSATACSKEPIQEINCEPEQEQEQEQIQEPQPQITIVAEYEHNRHDGRKDTIYIYNNNTYEWAVSMNGKVSITYFFNAEELFEFAVTYKNNWNHNNWVKVER